MVRILLILLLWPGLTYAETIIDGPIKARVIDVIDGDTILVDAALWPGLRQETRVRLNGIDAPELRGKCKSERRAAERARDTLRYLADMRVQLTQIHHGKYAGRVVARVLTEDGQDIAAHLIGKGLARDYDGGTRLGWCGRSTP